MIPIPGLLNIEKKMKNSIAFFIKLYNIGSALPILSHNIGSLLPINFSFKGHEMNIDLYKYNRHWDKAYQYPYPNKRSLFHKLIKSIDLKQIIEITGLRRTGKTTLLFQLINHLIENQIPVFQIWYFTFDESKPKLEDLIQYFSSVTNTDFKTKTIYIILDEIQKLDNFQNQLKIYYDLYPNIKFFISGSTSLYIKKKSMESLAGRVQSYYLKPLNFKEYLTFINNSDILNKPKIYEKEIGRLFDIFLQNQFIESIGLEDVESKKEYYQNIIRKIIFEDIPKVFSINYPEILFRLINMIAQQPGMLVDYLNISADIGVSNKTISNYLIYLQESFLIHKTYNFSRNLITSEKKLKRFYLASPSFNWALTNFLKPGGNVENYTISQNHFKFFWRDNYQHEIDFIDVSDNNKITPLEVKYKEIIKKNDIKNMLIFMKKFMVDQGVIYSKTIEERPLQMETNGFRIIEKPVYFL